MTVEKNIALEKLRREKIKILILVMALFIFYIIALFSGMEKQNKLDRIRSQAVDRGYASMVNGEFIWKEEKALASYKGKDSR